MRLCDAPLLLLLLFIGSSLAQNGPITDHFRAWLYQHGLLGYNYARDEYGTAGSYGGKVDDTSQVKKTPIIFIHGNNDGALKMPGTYSSGWSVNIQYFLGNGYSSAELYATTWGDRNLDHAMFRTHDCPSVLRLRRFVEAVLEYTNSSEVNIIAHSMGVTLARLVIQGGTLRYSRDSCMIGSPLQSKIHTFIGISGANIGLCTCRGNASLESPVCSQQNGFFPGDYCGINKDECDGYGKKAPCNPNPSAMLRHLDLNTVPDAKHVVSLWSEADEVLGVGALVWGIPTAKVKFTEQQVNYDDLSHMGTKELTVSDQLDLINKYA